MWQVGIRDCHSVQCFLVIDTLPCLLTYLKALLKLPDSCCCNSSVHCSTGAQQNVDDDYCACRVKAVGGEGYSYKGAPHFFLNRGPARSKSGPGQTNIPVYMSSLISDYIPSRTVRSSDKLLLSQTATILTIFSKGFCFWLIYHLEQTSVLL